MGLDDVAKYGLVILGVGFLSEKLGIGTGLGSLGTGIQTIVASPGVGMGTGLSSTAKGLGDIAGVFTGFLDYWGGFLSKFGDPFGGGGGFGGGGSGGRSLFPNNGNEQQLLAGGGGNVPQIPFIPGKDPTPSSFHQVATAAVLSGKSSFEYGGKTYYVNGGSTTMEGVNA